MAKYTVIITKTAQKQLDKLPRLVTELLFETMIALADDPRPPGCKKLKGHEAYRIRKGDYRIIYEIQDDILIVKIIAAGHRKNVYN
jgi:mRNA interferase RelE/StbE